MAGTVRLYERASHAAEYSLYRPTYARSVLDIIVNYTLRKGGDFNLAIDIACGSGQSTFYLRDAFKECIGVDISKEQIKQAQLQCQNLSTSNVKFQEADGTNLPVNEKCADLITIATAWHWILEKEKLYSECKRVLKEKGCLAVYTYDLVQTQDEEVNSWIYNFYAKSQKYRPKEVQHVQMKYSTVALPFAHTERVETIMTWGTSLPGLIGFLSSWASYKEYHKRDPKSCHRELTALSQLIESRLDKCKNSHKMKFSRFRYNYLETYFPVYILLGQNL